MAQIPYLTGTGKQTALMVDGKPFHARSGELHNSSASDLQYMEEKVWPALREMHLNCVVSPIYWECVEPEEGVFDFALLDGLLAQARREGVRLVLLWFGLWKNSASEYVPQWVKKDHQRFWEVRAPGGGLPSFINGLHHRIISPLCAEAVQADAKAYAAVMAHLKEADEQHTVIMMQVENEIGIIGCARDHSPAAEAAFAGQVPDALAEAMGVSGTWAEAFGPDAAENFMAWHYGRAVETIIEAGKAQLALPMYVNAWLEQAPWTPGSYPSGGPQFKVHQIWRAAAPQVDLFAPDIYVDNYRDVVDEYASDGNPLFIPEVRQTADTVAFYLYAVGAHNCLCFSPFGVEDMTGMGEKPDAMTLQMLNIAQDAMGGGAGKLLADAYDKVAGMEEILEQAHREGRAHGFLDNGARSEVVHLAQVDLHIQYGMNPMAGKAPGLPCAGGLVVELSDDEFILLATGCAVDITAHEGVDASVQLLTKEEGRFENGQWVRGRILNGDERYRNTFGLPAQLQRFKIDLYR